jgi:hypothetical protein
MEQANLTDKESGVMVARQPDSVAVGTNHVIQELEGSLFEMKFIIWRVQLSGRK